MRRAVSKIIPNKFGKLPDNASNSYKLDHGSVEEFYISLDEPHKSWSPGEKITGQVILKSRKNLANIAIIFNLSGYVKINASPHSKLRPMKHVLFTHTIQIYGPNTELPSTNGELVNGLYKGEHRFPFVVKLPNRKIYTSLDFGKGAIVYMLSTQLGSAEFVGNNHSSGLSSSSQPNESTLFKAREAFYKLHSPTYTYEKVINLVNPIDVSELPPPKQKRLIIRNPRRKNLSRVQSSNSTIYTHSTHSSNNSEQESVSSNHASPANDSSTHMPSPAISQGQNSYLSNQPSTISKSSKDTIRVSMELGQRGFLRGELIPIKLMINHLKQIQDSSGIIVTLVRVCRIDYGPDNSYESFRKDLQQSIIPLFVDPESFSSEISTSLRVPPDAFPTISGCPIVSFQYFIEVMLNLSGKSMSLSKAPDHPKTNVPHEDRNQNSPSSQPLSGNYSFHSLAQTRSDYINTDKFKRSKHFLQLTTEVIIGTHRSKKPLDDSAVSPNGVSSTASEVIGTHSSRSNSHTPNSLPNAVGAVHSLSINSVPEHSPMDNFESPPYLEQPSASDVCAQEESPSNAPAYTDSRNAPPQPEVCQLSEKERMRQHEASLLPSEPQFDDSNSDDNDYNDINDVIDDDDETVSPRVNLVANEDTSENNFGTAIANDVQEASMCSQPFEFNHQMDQFLGNDDDDLYHLSNINEGIGLEDAEGGNDFVPTYKAAAEDQLIVKGADKTN